MDINPSVSIVIVNYNGKGYLAECIDSVLRSDYPEFEIILVDNASTDGSVEAVRNSYGSDNRLRIIMSDKNLLYTGGYNTGIGYASGEYIICLNNDTEVDKDWLRQIVLIMGDSSIGAAVPKVLVHNTIPQIIDYAGAGIDRHGFAIGYGVGQVDNEEFDGVRDVFYAGGTAMVLRREVIEKVGLFDGKFGMHWEETDLSWRIRLAGYRIVVIPAAKIYHKGSLTMKRFSSKPDVSRYIKKNRLASLIKNYSLKNAITKIPFLIFIYLCISLRELLYERDVKAALSPLLAVAWNIKELPYLMRERRHIQRDIRRVTDKEIMEHMYPKSLVREFIRGRADV